VAKNPYYFNVVDKTVKDDHKRELLKLEKVGDSTPIYSSDKEVIGVALKTRDNCKNPVYVSIGNRVSLNTAINVVLKCCKYKIPEPIRQADILSRKQLII
jgi:deoxyinosine 3'endonuclease (endonuclease V)